MVASEISSPPSFSSVPHLAPQKLHIDSSLNPKSKGLVNIERILPLNQAHTDKPTLSQPSPAHVEDTLLRLQPDLKGDADSMNLLRIRICSHLSSFDRKVETFLPSLLQKHKG